LSCLATGAAGASGKAGLSAGVLAAIDDDGTAEGWGDEADLELGSGTGLAALAAL